LPESAGLAFKAYEIEELADVYFFRPIGMVFARAARRLRLTPTAVTLIGSAVGVAGGVLLYDQRLALAAFGLIILHSILDSSDGQLARMTGRSSEFGRMLDGIGGYVTHGAIYLSILAGALAGHAAGPTLLLAGAAALSSIVHAQMYDYHRRCYIECAIEGVIHPARIAGHRFFAIRAYEAMERRLAGKHQLVEDEIVARSRGGVVRDEDRARYRALFYWPVRGWNLMGDNTRFYAIGVLAWLQRMDAFFTFVLLPMNVACVALWVWQARADRRFLAGPVVG